MMLVLYLIIISCYSVTLCVTSQIETKIVGSYRYEMYINGELPENAKLICKERNAWLVEIKDEEIDNVITSWTTHQIIIGAKYDDGWKWNDGSLMMYRKWKESIPSQMSRHCVVTTEGVWTYPECTGVKRYICQSDVYYPGSFSIVFETTRKTYNDAKTACTNNNGSRLIDVKTPALDSYIKIRDKSWTSGMYDTKWKWGDGTIININDPLWSNLQPQGNTNKYCLMKTPSMGWKSEMCTSESGYICQKNITGNCGNNICLNRGDCKIFGERYKCSCNDGYFGTKCEKEIVNISTTGSSFTVNKGVKHQLTFRIVSYDGNVNVRHVSQNKVLKTTSQITSTMLTDTVLIKFGPFDTDTEYIINAASSTALSQSIKVSFVVKDQCIPNPCNTEGRCQYASKNPYFNCSCNPAYEGSNCEDRTFVEEGNCKYHVNFDEIIMFDAANITCKELGGSLAMIKSSRIQDLLEEQIIYQYGETGKAIAFWIGAMKLDGLWHWADGLLIPQSGDNVKWASPKHYKSSYNSLVLSSYQSTRLIMQWFALKNNQTRGYICEVAKIHPCTSLHCKNGGSCIALGCQANCRCTPGYTGTFCGNEIFIISSEKQNFTSTIDGSITITLNIVHYNDPVKIDVFEESIQSLKLQTKMNVIKTVDITIGPFENQSFGTKYWFKATPEHNPNAYYKLMSIFVVVQGPSKIESIEPRILALPTEIVKNVIKCYATGVPTPVVLWYKDNLMVTDKPTQNIYQTYRSGYASLYVKNDSRENLGNYTCYSSNVVDNERAESNGTAFLRGKIKLVSINSSVDISFVRARNI